jgi:hypothetical protein
VKTILLGLLLGLLAVYPHLATAAAAPAMSWLVGQPIAWAFTAGILARPRIARRLTRSTT